MNLTLIPIPEVDRLVTGTPHDRALMVVDAAVEQLGMFAGDAPQLLSVEASTGTVYCPECRRSTTSRRGVRFYCDGAQVHEVRR